MTFSIEVENKFKISQRDIHIYRKNSRETKEVLRVGYPGEVERGAVTLSLENDEGTNEHLEIRVDNQQLNLGPCRIELPSDFTFTMFPGGVERLQVIPSDNSNRTALRIPPGLPGWKLAIKPSRSMKVRQNIGEEPGSGEGGGENVTVGDDGPGGWE